MTTPTGGPGKGGLRLKAGRPKGSKNKRTREIAEGLANDGKITPLEYMLKVMRDSRADKDRRDEMARAAAPYMHPRISTVEVANKPGDAFKVITEIRRTIVRPAPADE